MPIPLLKGKSNAQIQMGESIIVIILIMIIAMFALVFTAKMTKTKYEIRINNYEELNAVETAQIVTNLYELRCAKDGLKETCVDRHKAVALTELAKTPEAQLYYYNLFKDAKILIREIYPNPTSLIIYESNVSENRYGQTMTTIVIPVSIHNASTDSMSFGVLEVQRFHKTRGTI